MGSARGIALRRVSPGCDDDDRGEAKPSKHFFIFLRLTGTRPESEFGLVADAYAHSFFKSSSSIR